MSAGSSARTGPRRKWRGFCLGLNRPFPCSDRRIVPSFRLEESAFGGLSTMILQSLAGLPAFLVYFCTAIVAVVAYLFVYTRITPHNEFQLIRDNDPAAAIALGLSLLGFTLPVVRRLRMRPMSWTA